MIAFARRCYEHGVQLPGRLKATTLGDVLGQLHRGRTTGTLELVEDTGRTHRIFLHLGLVSSVELDGHSVALGEILRREGSVNDDVVKRSVLRSLSSKRLLGEVLVMDFCIAPSVVGSALRRQIVSRLQTLEQLVDARLHFRVAVRAPKGALTSEPLGPEEFLRGRRRARDRGGRAHPDSGTYAVAARRESHRERLTAFAVLELPPESDEIEVKRAYRKLVRAYHPDMHPLAIDEERRELSERFGEVLRAYRLLSAPATRVA